MESRHSRWGMCVSGIWQLKQLYCRGVSWRAIPLPFPLWERKWGKLVLQSPYLSIKVWGEASLFGAGTTGTKKIIFLLPFFILLLLPWIARNYPTSLARESRIDKNDSSADIASILQSSPHKRSYFPLWPSLCFSCQDRIGSGKVHSKFLCHHTFLVAHILEKSTLRLLGRRAQGLPDATIY